VGDNQALQVGAESLSRLVGGLLAAVVVKLSLIVLGTVAVAAAATLLIVSGSASTFRTSRKPRRRSTRSALPTPRFQ
jgi:hypothetical protein